MKEMKLHNRKLELSDKEKNLPSDLIEKEKELERRERTITEREALMVDRKLRVKSWQLDLDKREEELNKREEKLSSVMETKMMQERKQLGIDAITSQELRVMRTKSHETAEHVKAALSHAEDRLKELNDKKKEVDKLQKKLTRRLDAVEALMAGNVRQAIEEFV
tara:strand:- start:1051 stop:1542 length:492 start_codon:yes stop_codon:yes gene_type:complete